MKWALFSLWLLAGCSSHTAWQLSAGQPPPVNAPVQVHASGSGGLAAVLGLSILAASAYEVSRNGLDYYFLDGGSQRPPDMAPGRRVNEVDCTKPIDYSLGNIRCK